MPKPYSGWFCSNTNNILAGLFIEKAVHISYSRMVLRSDTSSNGDFAHVMCGCGAAAGEGRPGG